MAEGGGGPWCGCAAGWAFGVFFARDEWLVVLWLTLAWTVFLRRVWGEVGGAGMRGGSEGASGRRY